MRKQKLNATSAPIRIVLCAILAGGLLVAGCADLQAVREFAKTSAATADYQQIIANYLTSPDRQKLYQPEKFLDQLDALTKVRVEQKPKLEAAQAVLVAYMSALGDLAADELPKIDTGIDALGSALEKAKFVGGGDEFINKETATAASSIAKVLGRAVLDHGRQAQIVRIIKEADASVQIVTTGLREIVLQDFGRSLDAEAEAVRKYFDAPIADAISRNEPDMVPPLARILRLEHLDRVAARRAKLEAYAEVLSKIGKGHADLRENVEGLDNAALLSRLKQYAKDLRTLHKAIAVIN